LPLNAHTYETINGRLLISFIAGVIYILTSQKLNNFTLPTNQVLIHMHHLKIKIYENISLLEEMTKNKKKYSRLLI
jgi:hypothetical protein